MGLDPLPPIHIRPPEPDPPPLHVDVINGWPLITDNALLQLVWYTCIVESVVVVALLRQ